MSQLLDSVRQLHAARMRLLGASNVIAVKREEFNAANKAHFDECEEARKAVAAAETTVRALADADYAANKNMNPCPGVTVKTFSVLRYAKDRALAWAKEKGMAVVPESLDEKAFEKIAKAARLDFVEFAEEPRVQVATDLVKAFEGSGLAVDYEIVDDAAPKGVAA